MWWAAWGSPGSDDGLTGIPGGCIVHAVEVEPQEDLAPPLGLGVQDLDAGSNPGQWCIGAGPAGEGGTGIQQQGEGSGWGRVGRRAPGSRSPTVASSRTYACVHRAQGPPRGQRQQWAAP